jgi:hypothetical protein
VAQDRVDQGPAANPVERSGAKCPVKWRLIVKAYKILKDEPDFLRGYVLYPCT